MEYLLAGFIIGFVIGAIAYCVWWLIDYFL